MGGDRQALARALDRLGLEPDRGRLDMLQRLAGLIATRGVAAGLIAQGDRRHLLERHVADSLRAAAVVSADDGDALDLGSGAGLPGLVVAVAVPRLRVTLVEARRRRVAFLEYVVEGLGLDNAAVLHARIEDVTDRADLCFARALAPLERSWSLAAPRLRSGGRLVYFAGEGFTPPGRVQPAAEIVLVPSPLLESSGPLVIMTRQ